MKPVKRGIGMKNSTKTLLTIAVASAVMSTSVVADTVETAQTFVPPPPGPYQSEMPRLQMPEWVKQRQNAPQPPARPDWARPPQRPPMPEWVQQQRQHAPQPPVRPDWTGPALEQQSPMKETDKQAQDKK